MKFSKAAALAACTTASLVLAACSSDAADEAEDAVDDATSAAKDAGDKAEDEAKEATSEVKEEADKAEEKMDGDKDKKAGEPVRLVATTTQICDYVTQIAKDDSDDAKLAFEKTDSQGKTTHYGAEGDAAESEITLTCLLAPNASAHDHEMTPEQMEALANADVFLVSGVDLEHFLDDAVKSSDFHGMMAVTSGVKGSGDIDDLDGEKAKEKDLPYEIFRGDEKVDIKEWPFKPEPGEEPEFRFDPHVWTAPENAMVQVHNIGAALDKVSPENSELFNEHVERFEKQLQDLDDWARESLESVPEENRVLFTSHDAFNYLSQEYNIEFIGAALSDFNDQADATAEHIQEEAEKVKESNARALFAENSNNSKSVEKIAEAAGVKAVIGDDALYGDSLGPDGTDGETYIGSILHNVTNLVEAWDGTVAPLPDSLKEFAPKELASQK